MFVDVEWLNQLKIQGVTETMQLTKVTKHDWVYYMGLPIMAYEKICRDLNLIVITTFKAQILIYSHFAKQVLLLL